MITLSFLLRSTNWFRFRVVPGVVLAVVAIAGTLVGADENRKAKSAESSHAEPAPTETPKPKPKATRKKSRSKKKSSVKSAGKRTTEGNRKGETEDRKPETPSATSSGPSGGNRKEKSIKPDEEKPTPKPDGEQKTEAGKRKAKSTESSEEEPTPKPKGVADGDRKAKAAKSSEEEPTPKPKGVADGDRKTRAAKSSEEEPTAAEKKTVLKKSTSETKESSAPKRSGSGELAPPKKTKTPTPTPTPKSVGKNEPAKTPTPAVKPPKSVPEPTRAPTPEPAAPPPPVAAPLVSEETLPSDITIEKSGLQKEQRLEPPPPTPAKRGFWLWSRQPSNYRYLTIANIDTIRKAPVQSGRWKFIIVHNSGTRQGNAKAFDYYHRKIRRMRNGLAYHFVIGNGTSSRNGQIEIGDRWRRQIAGGHVHSDYMNNIGLGICLVGDFNREQPTRAQLDACEELIRYLRERCGKSDGHPLMVRPHREVNPPRWSTDCPGDAFPYGWLGKLR